jgi:hypothetical protein
MLLAPNFTGTYQIGGKASTLGLESDDIHELTTHRPPQTLRHKALNIRIELTTPYSSFRAPNGSEQGSLACGAI